MKLYDEELVNALKNGLMREGSYEDRVKSVVDHFVSNNKTTKDVNDDNIIGAGHSLNVPEAKMSGKAKSDFIKDVKSNLSGKLQRGPVERAKTKTIAGKKYSQEDADELLKSVHKITTTAISNQYPDADPFLPIAGRLKSKHGIRYDDAQDVIDMAMKKHEGKSYDKYLKSMKKFGR